ncbi:MAG TPA: hypothetical protein VGF44_15695 [Terriglobales bacterium]|jgi:hypothetical protein
MRKLAIAIFLLLIGSLPACAEQPVAAYQFTNSAGVNTHLHYGPLYTDNFALILQRLRELGVQHVRNGLQSTIRPEFSDHVKAVNQAGIKVLWILNTDQSSDLAFSYTNLFPNGSDGFEAPNEFDASQQSNWATLMKQYMTRIYPELKHDSRTSRLLIVGPSLTRSDSYNLLGVQTSYMDVANLHNYPGGRNPGTVGWGAPDNAGARYGSIAWNLDLGKNVWGTKPVWTTEYGYSNSAAAKDHVPEDIAAIYMPRALLEQYLHGIRRTYLFELLSAHPDDNDGVYGLLRADGSPKPAFTAISNFLHLLHDDSPNPSLLSMQFVLEGELTDVHHLLLQKSDASYYLLLWLEKPGYDVDAGKRIQVPPQNISVHFEQPAADFESYQLSSTGAIVQKKEQLENQRVSLNVGETVLVLHFNHVPPPPTDLTIQPK